MSRVLITPVVGVQAEVSVQVSRAEELTFFITGYKETSCFILNIMKLIQSEETLQVPRVAVGNAFFYRVRTL